VAGQFDPIEIASIAGLIACRPMVKVGPPLFCNPAGSSFGSTLSPKGLPLALLVGGKPHELSSAILLPPLVIVPGPMQSLPALRATIEWVKVNVPVEKLRIAPPSTLPDRVQCVSVTAPVLKDNIAPPEAVAALLAKNVELVAFSTAVPSG